MDSIPNEYWKIILRVSILILILSIVSLPSLYENISGDSIPNRPQREPPIEYKWNTAISRIVIAIISLAISAYSYTRIRST